MNKSFVKYSFVIALFAIMMSFFYACKTKKIIAPEDVVIPISPEVVMSKIHQNQPEFSWFSARFSGNAIWEGRSYNIGGLMRIQKDSAIYVSVAPVLGIEVARFLVTRDTVKFVNRIESNYYLVDIAFLNKVLGTEIDFDMLQALITGSDFPHFETSNFLVNTDRGSLNISNPERKKNADINVLINQNLLIDVNSYKIRQNMISDSLGRLVSATYKSWEEIEGQLLPASVDLLFSDKTTHAELFLRFNRIIINTPQNMSFRIPARYERIDF